jgi:hypothetical protein
VIAGVARALRNRDLAALRRYGLLLEHECFPVTTDSTQQWRVAVMAESVEHAQILQSRLPGWPVMHVLGDGAAAACVWPEGPTAGCIVTMSWAARRPLEVHAVVRGDDDGGRLQLLGFPAAGCTQPIVVEFTDHDDDDDAGTPQSPLGFDRYVEAIAVQHAQQSKPRQQHKGRTDLGRAGHHAVSHGSRAVPVDDQALSDSNLVHLTHRRNRSATHSRKGTGRNPHSGGKDSASHKYQRPD